MAASVSTLPPLTRQAGTPDRVPELLQESPRAATDTYLALAVHPRPRPDRPSTYPHIVPQRVSASHSMSNVPCPRPTSTHAPQSRTARDCEPFDLLRPAPAPPA